MAVPEIWSVIVHQIQQCHLDPWVAQGFSVSWIKDMALGDGGNFLSKTRSFMDVNLCFGLSMGGQGTEVAKVTRRK